MYINSLFSCGAFWPGHQICNDNIISNWHDVKCFNNIAANRSKSAIEIYEHGNNICKWEFLIFFLSLQSCKTVTEAVTVPEVVKREGYDGESTWLNRIFDSTWGTAITGGSLVSPCTAIVRGRELLCRWFKRQWNDSPSVFDACIESIWSLGDSGASAAVCAVLWLVQVSSNDDASSRYSPS